MNGTNYKVIKGAGCGRSRKVTGSGDDKDPVNSISISEILTPSHLLRQKVKPRWLSM